MLFSRISISRLACQNIMLLAVPTASNLSSIIIYVFRFIS